MKGVVQFCVLISLVGFMGCDILRDKFTAYKQSRLVEVASFSYDGMDDTTLSAISAKLSHWPITASMEGDLGIMAIYVDRADDLPARELIKGDRELQMLGVKLKDL